MALRLYNFGNENLTDSLPHIETEHYEVSGGEVIEDGNKISEAIDICTSSLSACEDLESDVDEAENSSDSELEKTFKVNMAMESFAGKLKVGRASDLYDSLGISFGTEDFKSTVKTILNKVIGKILEVLFNIIDWLGKWMHKLIIWVKDFKKKAEELKKELKNIENNAKLNSSHSFSPLSLLGFEQVNANRGVLLGDFLTYSLEGYENFIKDANKIANDLDSRSYISKNATDINKRLDEAKKQNRQEYEELNRSYPHARDDNYKNYVLKDEIADSKERDAIEEVFNAKSIINNSPMNKITNEFYKAGIMPKGNNGRGEYMICSIVSPNEVKVIRKDMISDKNLYFIQAHDRSKVGKDFVDGSNDVFGMTGMNLMPVEKTEELISKIDGAGVVRLVTNIADSVINNAEKPQKILSEGMRELKKQFDDYKKKEKENIKATMGMDSFLRYRLDVLKFVRTVCISTAYLPGVFLKVGSEIVKNTVK